MNNKIIETSNTYFTYIGVILLGISLALIINSLNSLSPTTEYIHNNLSMSIMGIIGGMAFV
jgi:hypothetical protein